MSESADVAATPTKGVDEKFCTECGSIIKARAEICPKCGVRQTSAMSSGLVMTPSGKSKLAAFLFAFFLGVFGIHRFYVGKTGSAVAMLILTLTVFGAKTWFDPQICRYSSRSAS